MLSGLISPHTIVTSGDNLDYIYTDIACAYSNRTEICRAITKITSGSLRSELELHMKSL